MGSCSSGGPNKYKDMCFVETSEHSKGDVYSEMIGSEVSLVPDAGLATDSKANYLVNTRSSGSAATEGEPNIVTDNYQAVAKHSPDAKTLRNLYHCDTRPTFNSMSPMAPGFKRGSDSFSIGDNRYNPRITELDHLNAKDGPQAASMPKLTSNGSASCSMPPDNAAIRMSDSSQQERHSQPRKGSAPAKSHRWPGEYGTCIVPPPNKTVYDALLSPSGRSDYSLESGWTISGNDRRESECGQHHPSIASGYNCRKTNDPASLLPISGLSSSAWTFLSCRNGSATPSSSSTPSASSLCRREENEKNEKRSNSVSSYLSTTSLTAGLLPKAAESKSHKRDCNEHRSRATTSENRPLASASQRLLNLLSSSPMKPLNGNDTLSSTSKYTQLHSDFSDEQNLTTTDTATVRDSAATRPSTDAKR